MEHTTDPGHPLQHKTRTLFLSLCFGWSLFQIWIASPLPFIFDIGLFNNTQSRAIHLSFAILLAYISYGFIRSPSKHHLKPHDIGLACLAVWGASYLFINYDELAGRSGAPLWIDILAASVGLLLLLEGTRRTLGLPLVIVAGVFLGYSVAGPYMPDLIAHQGASLNKLLSHQWLTTEGVFGVALGVSTDFVFLFVLFGALLERTGAGAYFIKVAFALMGHLRGGPAKAAVVASGLSGMISGSSISNVVTTGTFTIPLMKKTGFPSYKAAAIEVAASTNGQLTPPVMGAAAFLMVEYVNIPYIEVIQHAILPALISYLALFYIVHLEAVKANMQGLPAGKTTRWAAYALILFGLCVFTLAIYHGIGWLKMVLPDGAAPIILALLLVAYVGLIAYAAKYHAIAERSDLTEHITCLPPVGPIVKSGLYYVLPIAVLIWCLTVERFSPGLSAFYALVMMIVITLTKRPLLAYFLKDQAWQTAIKQGGLDLVLGMQMGAKNMIGIALATATAGIIVGTITLTGIGQIMTEVILQLSYGNIVLTLLLTALICLILGMGLPTTANYIVVATLMAPVIVDIGAINGLIIPLIAAHLFVFYFGILADDTPPVGLAAFAGAGIAGADPIKTGIQGFTYDIRTAVLPFMFIFNTQLLLIDIGNPFELILIILTAIIGILVFAAATQGYWLTKTKPWETILLLLSAFTLFRPDFWMDQWIPPHQQIAPQAIYQQIQPEDTSLRLIVEGYTLDGDLVNKTVEIPLPNESSVQKRLVASGLNLTVMDDQATLDYVPFGSPAAQAGLDTGWEILHLERPTERPPIALWYLPALFLLGLVWLSQRRRLSRKPTKR